MSNEWGDLVCKHCGKSLAGESFYYQSRRFCKGCHGARIKNTAAIAERNRFVATFGLDTCGGLVYVIQEDNGGAIKIGCSSGNSFALRLPALQTGNPRELKIVAIARNQSVQYEFELHRRFAQYLIRGDWFRPVDEIAQYISNDPRWTIYTAMQVQAH